MLLPRKDDRKEERRAEQRRDRADGQRAAAAERSGERVRAEKEQAPQERRRGDGNAVILPEQTLCHVRADDADKADDAEARYARRRHQRGEQQRKKAQARNVHAHAARGIPAAAAKLAATGQGSTDAATAIMTTDTHKKEYAIQFELGGKTCTVGAIGKGSGMIAPNMATMLAFYTTDAAVSPVLLEKALKTVVPGTYNQMSVDLDTSTNDTLIIMASGLAGNPEICEENADYDAFVAALTAIAEHMCAEHAGDGEGATHLITCEVTHAPDLKTARAVSRSVVCSNLFKAAVFGRDANWGRILCAIGYTPGDFSIDKVCVWLSSAAGEVYVCENAAYHPYSEDEAAKVLAEHDVLVKVDMGTGDASAKAWGCDLTYDYVKINGDYRT